MTGWSNLAEKIASRAYKIFKSDSRQWHPLGKRSKQASHSQRHWQIQPWEKALAYEKRQLNTQQKGWERNTTKTSDQNGWAFGRAK